MAKINFEDAVIKIVKKYLVSFGKSLASKFYTKKQLDTMILPIPAIQTDIDSLKARSVIGAKLSFGSFEIDTSKTGVNPTLSENYKIPFKIKSGNLIVDSNGYIKLEKGKSYNLSFFATSNARFDFQFFNVTDSIGVGKTIISGSTISGSGSYSMDVTKDIYITVMVTYKEGTMLFTDYCELTIQEIGRNTIIDPCEDGKNIKFEHGLFINVNDQSIVQNTVLKLTNQLSGNMRLSANGYVNLKAGKSYKLKASAGDDKTYIDYMIYDVTNKKTIGVCASNAATIVSQPIAIAEYTPPTDCEISVIIRYLDSTGTGKITAWRSYLDIEELAQPYYFNYFKDSIKSTTLFDGSAPSVGSYTLLDDITKYEYLKIWSCRVEGTVKRDKSSIEVKVSDITGATCEFIISSYALANVFDSMEFSFASNKLRIDAMYNGGWPSFIIYKIEGISFDYDNPYQDIITTSPDAALTDATVDADVTNIWSGVGL
jgi:hypothetical protein